MVEQRLSYRVGWLRSCVRSEKSEDSIRLLWVRPFGEIWYRMYPVFYMPIDHRAGDIGTGMIYQIIGTLGDDLLIMSDVLSIESSIRDINPSIMYAHQILP